MRKGIGPHNLGASKSPAKMGCGSPAKQTTYGEFMFLKEKEKEDRGEKTKPFDKVKAGVRTVVSGGNMEDYKSMKKEYRAEAKKEYNAKKKNK